MSTSAAIYARVSSDRQREQETITSQTTALRAYAAAHDYAVPPAWVFEDDGYSGTTLVRPGLEAVRDLAAAGQIGAVLVYAPDRLSRKYAYQILLTEEFARRGVSVVYLNAPAAHTPEEHLLLQVQGMIAEYERAQLMERTRRGKRHKARCGSVNALSAAPYGYRYVKKTDQTDAYYQVDEAETAVVRAVFAAYTQEHLSMYRIVQRLTAQQVPTRTGGRWDPATIRKMLCNPAYIGRACFGKCVPRPRRRITRRARLAGRLPVHDQAHDERPREEWIEIPVPALIVEETFALAQAHNLCRTRILRGGGRSGPRCCRACWCAPRAAMPSIGGAACIAAGGVTAMSIRTARCAPRHRFVKTTSMRSCGAKYCACLRIPPSSKPSWRDGARPPARAIPPASVWTSSRVRRRGWRRRLSGWSPRINRSW